MTDTFPNLVTKFEIEKNENILFCFSKIGNPKTQFSSNLL